MTVGTPGSSSSNLSDHSLLGSNSTSSFRRNRERNAGTGTGDNAAWLHHAVPPSGVKGPTSLGSGSSLGSGPGSGLGSKGKRSSNLSQMLMLLHMITEKVQSVDVNQIDTDRAELRVALRETEWYQDNYASILAKRLAGSAWMLRTPAASMSFPNPSDRLGVAFSAAPSQSQGLAKTINHRPSVNFSRVTEVRKSRRKRSRGEGGENLNSMAGDQTIKGNTIT